jgi:hypothetical protein
LTDTATRLSQNVQQIVMYGNKWRGNNGPMLETIFGKSDTEAQSGFNTIFNTGFDVARQMQDVDLQKNDFDVQKNDFDVQKNDYDGYKNEYDVHENDFDVYSRDLNKSKIHSHKSDFGVQKRNFEVNKEGFNGQMSDSDHEIHVHKNDFNVYKRDFFDDQKRDFEVNNGGFNDQKTYTDDEINLRKNDFNVDKREFQNRNFDDQKRDFDLSSFDPEVDAAGFVLNYSIFYSAFRDIIFGLEILVFYDVHGKSSFLAFFPQIHWQVHQNMTLKVGPGMVLSPIKIVPVFAHRVIFEEIIIT